MSRRLRPWSRGATYEPLPPAHKRCFRVRLRPRFGSLWHCRIDSRALTSPKVVRPTLGRWAITPLFHSSGARKAGLRHRGEDLAREGFLLSTDRSVRHPRWQGRGSGIRGSDGKPLGPSRTYLTQGYRKVLRNMDGSPLSLGQRKDLSTRTRPSKWNPATAHERKVFGTHASTICWGRPTRPCWRCEISEPCGAQPALSASRSPWSAARDSTRYSCAFHPGGPGASKQPAPLNSMAFDFLGFAYTCRAVM